MVMLMNVWDLDYSLFMNLCGYIFWKITVQRLHLSFISVSSLSLRLVLKDDSPFQVCWIPHGSKKDRRTWRKDRSRTLCTQQAPLSRLVSSVSPSDEQTSSVSASRKHRLERRSDLNWVYFKRVWSSSTCRTINIVGFLNFRYKILLISVIVRKMVHGTCIKKF